MHGTHRLKLALFVLCVLLGAELVSAADTTGTVMPLLSGRPKKSTTAAVFMSMAVPGLGQIYTHNYVKAGVFAVAEGALAASISFNNDRMHMYRRAAETWQRSPSDTLHLQKNPYVSFQRFYQNQRNRLIWWTAGTILLSMGDAYVDAHLYGLDFSPNITYNRGTVGVSVCCKF